MVELWDGHFAVYKADPTHGYSSDGRRWLLGYDLNDDNPGGVLCNRLGGDGTICRLWRDHISRNLPHMPFTVPLVMSSGVYCYAMEEPGTWAPEDIAALAEVDDGG